MILINADVLKEVFKEKSTEAVCGAELCKAIISQIDNQPTVEAIPVEFIEKRAQEYASNPEDSADLFAAGVIQMIVTAWRTERKEE